MPLRDKPVLRRFESSSNCRSSIYPSTSSSRTPGQRGTHHSSHVAFRWQPQTEALRTKLDGTYAYMHLRFETQEGVERARVRRRAAGTYIVPPADEKELTYR